MKIKSIQIQNFKSFGPKEVIISNLDKFNIFIGKNNSGKSNILKALDTFFNGIKLKGGVYKANSGVDIVDENYWFKKNTGEDEKPIPIIIKMNLSLDEEDSKILFKTFADTEQKKSYLKRNSNKELKVTLEITATNNQTTTVLSLKTIEHNGSMLYRHEGKHIRYLDISTGNYLSNDNFNFLNIFIHSLSTQSKLVSSIKKPDNDVATEFEKFETNLMERKGHIFQKVNKFLKILFPNIKNNAKTYEYIYGKEVHITDPINLPISSHGEGVGQIFMIFYEIYKKRAKIVAIEEPESYLHPHLCRKLMNVLKEITKEEKTQFFITTHSAIPVVPENIPNLYRCKYTPEEGTKVHNLLEKEQINLQRLTQELNPDSGEMFFADKVILVEGYEDKFFIQGLLSKWSLDKDEIKLISVEGKDNFMIYKDILNQFGIPYTIICDKNCLTPSNSINVIKELLQKKSITDRDKQIDFLKTNNIWVLSKDDISDYYPDAFSNIPKGPKTALNVLSKLKKEDLKSPKLKELSKILEQVVKF